MPTNYIKNFNKDGFQKILDVFEVVAHEKKPLWAGTVYIGEQPIYIECHVKWMADKINSFFANALPGEYVQNAIKLYVFKSTFPDFIPVPNQFEPDVYFTNDNVLRVPDMIVHKHCILLNTNNTFYMNVDHDDLNNFYHLGENHLLMRLFYYMLQNTKMTVVHGAVVGYEDHGVLITGLSGAGKSTLSAFCLSKGLQFIGDDRVALHKENTCLVANPVYSTISVSTDIPNIKAVDIIHPKHSSKDIIILDKSQLSQNIKIKAVIEPIKTNCEHPIIIPTQKNPIITRICKDYSHLSILSRSTQLIADYKRIFDLLCNIDFYKMQLSDSIDDNVTKIINFIKQQRIENV